MLSLHMNGCCSLGWSPRRLTPFSMPQEGEGGKVDWQFIMSSWWHLYKLLIAWIIIITIIIVWLCFGAYTQGFSENNLGSMLWSDYWWYSGNHSWTGIWMRVGSMQGKCLSSCPISLVPSLESILFHNKLVHMFSRVLWDSLAELKLWASPTGSQIRSCE